MSETHDEPTPGIWYTHTDADNALCVSSNRATDGVDKFVACIKRADNEVYEDAEANARLIAAAGTAAHELPDKYDAVAAMEELPELIRGLEELVSCLKEAHENAHPEGPMRDRRYGLTVDEAQDTLNADRADE